MRRVLTYLLLSLLSFSWVEAFAQGLPSLKKAPEITTGKLPDGISYYLVSNSSSKGYANFALVQRGTCDLYSASRNLSGLPHFGGRAPYKFLASKGIGYGEKGYVSCIGGGTVYSFENVPTFDSEALDSTLLLIFDLAASYESEQAVIISGEYNLPVIKDRLHTLSLTVSARTALQQQESYSWKPFEGPLFECSANGTADVVSLSFDFAAPRTPKKFMNTPQPLVTGMFASEMGYLLCKRVQAAFLRDGIPLADVGYTHLDSSMSDGDEHHSLDIVTDRANMVRAAAKVAEILSSLDVHGATAEEFLDAKDRMLTEAAVHASRSDLTNAQYVQKCVSSFLFGSNLANYSAVSDFFTGRKISAERELSLFNDFASALLDSRQALTIKLRTPDGKAPTDSVRAAFDYTWKAVAGLPVGESPYHMHYADTLTLLRPRGHKVKLTGSVKEPVTGGSVWSFSNGMKVIFKNAGNKGEFHYAFMMKGGYADVPGLSYGESAFVEDMMSLYNIGGMSYMDFRNMLEANGVILDTKVSLSDMRIVGHAPNSKIHLLFKALVSLMRDRSVNPEALAYYRAGETLRQQRERLSNRGVVAVMDSIMCPDYYYPETKNVNYLRDDLQERVEKYVARQFSKADDGVLMIVGRFDAQDLQKILTRYLGAFMTGDGYAVRPKVKFPQRSGTSTYFVDASGAGVGDSLVSVNVSLAALKPFTMDSYIAFRAAVAAIRKEVVAAMADVGMKVDVRPSMMLYPENRMGVYISCSSCPPSGLPEGVGPCDPYNALGAIRAALAKVASRSISSTDLAGYKQMVSNEIVTENKMPENMIQSVLVRNSEGKDFVSNYKEHISYVTAQNVMEIIKALCLGSRVEYVIK